MTYDIFLRGFYRSPRWMQRRRRSLGRYGCYSAGPATSTTRKNDESNSRRERPFAATRPPPTYAPLLPPPAPTCSYSRRARADNLHFSTINLTFVHLWVFYFFFIFFFAEYSQTAVTSEPGGYRDGYSPSARKLEDLCERNWT